MLSAWVSLPSSRWHTAPTQSGLPAQASGPRHLGIGAGMHHPTEGAL